ncbi:MAG: BON domain-containing protein [Planctomycetales bacterium]
MSLKCRLISSISALGLCLIATSSGFAQQGSIFGNSSPLAGSGGLGTGSIGSGPSGTGVGSAAFAKAPTGGAQNQQGASGLGGQSGLGQTNGLGGAAAGQQRGLLGANTNQNGFLGATQQGQSVAGGRNQMNNNQQRNQFGTRGGNRGNNNNQFQQQNFANQGGQGNASNLRQIRPQQRVAFEFQKIAPAKTETTLTKRFDQLSVRFEKLKLRSSFRGVQIDAEEGKVTLRGQVDTEETRKLAVMLVSLEPGVRSVQNELTVANPSPPEPAE